MEKKIEYKILKNTLNVKNLCSLEESYNKNFNKNSYKLWESLFQKCLNEKSVAMFANGYKAESLSEKLIPAPQEVVDELLYILEKYDFVLDDSLKNPIGKTWSGNTHVQVINKNSSIEETDDPDIYSEQLMSYIPNSMTNDISRLSEKSGCRITYSFGANRNWQVTAGLDVWEKYVPGLQDESLKEQVSFPGYAVKYTSGYSGNGVNSGKTEWFRTKEERDRRAKELKDKNYTEIKTWKMDNFYHTLPKNESLKEAFDDEIDLDYETDFDDDNVEEGNVFVEGGVEYTWIQREAGPLYLDFDKWAVWSAREYVDPREFMTMRDNGKDYDFDGDAFKKKAMAAPIVYFVVEEDTGFIDWGPEDNEIAAKDFLNGKKEDWENDMDESLNEDKKLEEYYTVNLHYEDIGDGREYDYEADYDDVLEYLMEICTDDDNAPEDTQEYMEWVVNNFDYLFKKYKDVLLKHFYEDASQEEYDERHSSYEPEYDPMD